MFLNAFDVFLYITVLTGLMYSCYKYGYHTACIHILEREKKAINKIADEFISELDKGEQTK